MPKAKVTQRSDGMQKKKRIIATDLDGTMFIPFTSERYPEMDALKKALAVHPELCVIFASGRSLSLIEEAITRYDLPRPDMAIGDVGTSIYVRNDDTWHRDEGWIRIMSNAWHGKSRNAIADLLKEIEGLEPQEPDRLTEFKQSYYLDIDADWNRLEPLISERLAQHGIKAELIFSTQPLLEKAFLDILPPKAAKDEAVRYVMNKFGLRQDDVFYSGDSGNDLKALTCGFNAVVVQNASAKLKEQVRAIAARKRIAERVYFATKPAVQGVVEGLGHFNFLNKGELSCRQ
jgi:sucrose-6F-phosphate phosphohydrolase